METNWPEKIILGNRWQPRGVPNKEKPVRGLRRTPAGDLPTDNYFAWLKCLLPQCRSKSKSIQQAVGSAVKCIP